MGMNDAGLVRASEAKCACSVIHGRVPAPHFYLFLLLGRSDDGGVGRVNSYSTLTPNGHIPGPHDLDWLLVWGGAQRQQYAMLRIK